MAAYDYRCRTCADTFEVHRPVTAPEGSPACPAGHADVTRLWSAVALAGRGSGPSPAPAASGGCCGGGCCSA